MNLALEAPSPKQVQFYKAATKHVGFGGARGGGKSHAVRTKAVLLAFEYPGIRMLIVRRTYPELVNNHINQLRVLLRDVARYNDKDKVSNYATDILTGTATEESMFNFVLETGFVFRVSRLLLSVRCQYMMPRSVIVPLVGIGLAW